MTEIEKSGTFASTIATSYVQCSKIYILSVITGLTQQQRNINCRGHLLDLSVPVTMGIVNLSRDSFYNASTVSTDAEVAKRVEKHVVEGAKIIDIGAMSSRPGAEAIDVATELGLLKRLTSNLPTLFPKTVFSIDSYRREVIQYCLDKGWHMINSILGTQEFGLLELAVSNDAPYIAMHMQGRPDTMQVNPQYEHITEEVLLSFIQLLEKARDLGLKDLIIDPGFGFGKTIEHSFQLLNEMQSLVILDLPILVGLSRKSMIYKTLETTQDHALNGTTALHMVALRQGASILRVHDVAEAQEAIILHKALTMS